VGLGLFKEEEGEAVVVVGFVLCNKLFSSCVDDLVQLLLSTTKGDARENSLEGKALHRTMPPSLSRRWRLRGRFCCSGNVVVEGS